MAMRVTTALDAGFSVFSTAISSPTRAQDSDWTAWTVSSVTDPFTDRETLSALRASVQDEREVRVGFVCTREGGGPDHVGFAFSLQPDAFPRRFREVLIRINGGNVEDHIAVRFGDQWLLTGLSGLAVSARLAAGREKVAVRVADGFGPITIVFPLDGARRHAEVAYGRCAVALPP
jgi:hypothetical protein